MSADVGWTFREKRLLIGLLYRIEEAVAELDDKLNQLKASTEAAFVRAQTDLEALKAKIDQLGQMSPEVGQLIDGMIQRAEAFDVANPPTPEAIKAQA